MTSEEQARYLAVRILGHLMKANLLARQGSAICCAEVPTPQDERALVGSIALLLTEPQPAEMPVSPDEERLHDFLRQHYSDRMLGGERYVDAAIRFLTQPAVPQRFEEAVERLAIECRDRVEEGGYATLRWFPTKEWFSKTITRHLAPYLSVKQSVRKLLSYATEGTSDTIPEELRRFVHLMATDKDFNPATWGVAIVGMSHRIDAALRKMWVE